MSLMVVNTAFAAPGKQAGTCKRGWSLIQMPADAKAKTDKNGDGYVCTSKFAPSGYYIDNYNRIKCGRFSTWR
jgi:hypothetical protein